MTLTQAKQIVKDAGFTPSVTSWDETDGRLCAYSVESLGPAFYGASKFQVNIVPDWRNPGFGWLQITDKPEVYMRLADNATSWPRTSTDQPIPSANSYSCGCVESTGYAESHVYDHACATCYRNACHDKCF